MNKPTEQQIKEAKEILAAAGFAVESLWSIEDVNQVINESDAPEDFKGVSDADKLGFLNSILEENMGEVWPALHDNIGDLKA